MSSNVKKLCAKCNSELPEDSMFCQVCGSQLSSTAVSMPLLSDQKLRQMFSKVEKWELMGIRCVADRSACQITDQQRQEELEKRIHSAQDVAIQKRIAATEADARRNKPIKIVCFSILAIIGTALTVYLGVLCFGS